MGSVCSRDFSKTLKSEVSRSLFVASPLRCDPNRGQRKQHNAAASPRCDPMRGQRGKRKSDVDFNDAGKDIDRDSVVGRDAATCPSSTVAPACALKVTRHTSYSSPEVAGAGVCKTSSGRSSSSSACSSPVSGRCAAIGVSSPGASGRGVALRPLVLRRNSSGGSMMPCSGAWSDAEQSCSVLAPPGKARQCSQSFADLFVPCTSPSQRVHLVDSVVQLSSSQDTHNMHGDVNSCGSVHGGGVHVNSPWMHGNSRGALGHINSCHVHAAQVRGGTKAFSMSTRIGVRCPAVEKLASPQQAPGKLHDEVWASILHNQGPKIFREVEIVPGCAVRVACPSCPDHSPEPPGPGRIIRNMLGWSFEEKNEVGCGVWLYRGDFQGGNLFSLLDVAGDWVRKGSYHTAWAVPCDSLCTCSYSYGRGPAIGPHTGRRCWPLLEGVWRAIAPLMKPWCAEGDVPTAANLNLYRGGNSCVGWHGDDELLFGESGEAKLIVSVSLGGSAVFKWKRRSCPDYEGHLCCLGHGDILVMDGRCQDKFLHRTDPCREQERINITFRWIKQHASSCLLFRAGVACCLPTCAQGFSFPVIGNSGFGIFWVFWLLFCVLCAGGMLALLASLLHARLGFLWCASCWARLFDVVQWEHYLWNHWSGMSGSS